MVVHGVRASFAPRYLIAWIVSFRRSLCIHDTAIFLLDGRDVSWKLSPSTQGVHHQHHTSDDRDSVQQKFTVPVPFVNNRIGAQTLLQHQEMSSNRI